MSSSSVHFASHDRTSFFFMVELYLCVCVCVCVCARARAYITHFQSRKILKEIFVGIMLGNIMKVQKHAESEDSFKL
jgi:uncharacterized membrane protein